jgi:hypothetical protein
MGQPDAWRMIRRRAAAAGNAEAIGCHTFRATGITAYLANGGALELVDGEGCQKGRLSGYQITKGMPWQINLSNMQIVELRTQVRRTTLSKDLPLTRPCPEQVPLVSGKEDVRSTNWRYLQIGILGCWFPARQGR